MTKTLTLSSLTEAEKAVACPRDCDKQTGVVDESLTPEQQELLGTLQYFRGTRIQDDLILYQVQSTRYGFPTSPSEFLQNALALYCELSTPDLATLDDLPELVDISDDTSMPDLVSDNEDD
ncbi:hypothetical protein BCR33DRAFT_717057 [Rhizoclosmatium globosum]|uniref:Uncharacterized protein n=1 Tax=Rhizoclosmatium globosum TaxID=329046 RepID=A0A1Y2BP59_9FUNG|nr:hypothetical protein BCR33DRAFT_730685 [Rhizoclosmatium globosum]ORY36534.1 hypothetical protein BCR33DRAFT_722036 [Rhizoclosmatium globosum]ORY44543.1 hypothetical protein BCR33DRAFT_717057 [Rhizoclosmatium globosum]|eukprot:ORY19920.1 hypothetical protein BCR33DRAFT_730685 [Rhizoclosmatium globosum]